MSPPDQQPPSIELVVYQLGELKQQQTEYRRHVDRRLDTVQAEIRSQFAALTFVSEKAYAADRAADARIRASLDAAVEKDLGDIRQIAENARATAWGVAIFVVAALTALLAVIKAVAG